VREVGAVVAVASSPKILTVSVVVPYLDEGSKYKKHDATASFYQFVSHRSDGQTRSRDAVDEEYFSAILWTPLIHSYGAIL